MVVHYRMLSVLLAASLLASPAAQAVETGQSALPRESAALIEEAPPDGIENGVQLRLPTLSAVAAEPQAGDNGEQEQETGEPEQKNGETEEDDDEPQETAVGEGVAVPDLNQDRRIEMTLRLDFQQTNEALRARKVTAELTGEDKTVTVDLSKNASGNDYTLSRREDEKGVTYIDVTFDGLDKTKYTLKLTGTGYTTYETELDLTDASQYIAIGTGDASFTLGDVNGDGEVATDDRDLIDKAIRSGSKDTATYDLDGDGQIDVTDFAYVDHGITAIADFVESQETEPAFRLSIEQPKVTTEPGTIAVSPEGGFTKFSNTKGDPKFTAAPDNNKAVQAEYIEIVTSSADGKILDGTAEVVYVDEAGKDQTETIPFTNGIPEGIMLLDASGDDSHATIRIDLGKRVAVKKVTITVTRTENGEYASVAAIEFLKDIIPENPAPKYVKVQNLAAEPGHESVVLKWGSLPNITGYEVKYYMTEKGEDESKTQIEDDSSLALSGLTNNKEYTFIVTPVSTTAADVITWRGQSSEIRATPKANQIPAMINMVTVTARDAQLDVAWKAGKNASTYSVYYSTDEKKDLKSWTCAASGLTNTNTSITGLTNNTTYYIYVTGTNDIGEGPASNIVSGMPKAVDYEKPEGIPNDEALLDRSKIASIRLLDPSNVDPSISATFNANQLIDNDYRTSWTTKNWWGNEHVECTFTEPVSLSAAIWVPRLDGDYSKWLRAYSVRVWTDAAHGGLDGALIVPDPIGGGRDDGATGDSSAMQTWPSVRGNPSTSHFAVLPFGPLEGITKIQVAVEQAGYNRVSLSELMFLEYDPETDVPTLIDGLFTDETFTALKADVQESDIAAIEALLDEHSDYYLYPDAHKDELALARRLLNGQETDGVVLAGLHTTSGTQNFGQGGSLLQPLGVSANAGQTISIYAEIPAGETVNVYASQVNAEANAWQASLGTLTSGRNVLTIPKIGSQASNSGGSLYYTCSTPNAADIKLHVRRATDIPVLDVVNWYTMAEADRNEAIDKYVAELSSYITAQTLSGAAATNPKNVTEISTPSVLLSIPATSVNGKTAGQLRNTILAWEDILYICKTTQGITAVREDSLKMAYRQNIRCMQMFEGAFMYAAGNHVGIGAGSCPGMVSGTPVPDGGLEASATYNGLFGWGIAHEIGHNMDKIGRAEISNNIYSLMVQTYDGKKNTLQSRLEASGKYPAIFTKVSRGYPGASNDVFVQLGMYWQLHLAYDNGKMDFFNQFFTKWKSGNDFGPATTTDEKIAVIASKTAGKNLTDFFEHWGMTLSEAVKTELKTLETENRAIWYLSDQSRRDRLTGTGTTASGNMIVSAVVDEKTGKDVILTIRPTITGDVQGYEIRRNDAGLDFAVQANMKDGVLTYTDHIGSANHTTYEYEVVAYDMQGNKICSAKSQPEQIRIAYDMTVGTDQYTITRDENGTVTVEFKAETTVSGLKLASGTGAIPTTGAYTVTATVKDNETGTEREVVARKADFSANLAAGTSNFLTYFNKPSVDNTDTRIWTYDALKLKIEGIPNDVTNDQIQIVSYAGDEVELGINDAVAGILKNDYDEIKAGSIVVVGTYRGDPVYNYPTIQGEFVRTYNNEAGEVQTETTRRDLDGKMYLFAEIPEDGEVSDISDGIFIFVLNVEKEQDLQTPIGDEKASHCDGVNLLPSRVRAIMVRTDMPDTTDSSRETATTLWIDTPGGDELPYIELSGEVTP